MILMYACSVISFSLSISLAGCKSVQQVGCVCGLNVCSGTGRLYCTDSGHRKRVVDIIMVFFLQYMDIFTGPTKFSALCRL